MKVRTIYRAAVRYHYAIDIIREEDDPRLSPRARVELERPEYARTRLGARLAAWRLARKAKRLVHGQRLAGVISERKVRLPQQEVDE